MFTDNTIRQIHEAADRAGINRTALLAVADVESGGRASVDIHGRAEPVIRFEGHYFDQRLSGAKRDAARKAGLASPRAGVVGNPVSLVQRWAMLERAAGIDADAAYESVSWGVGQVMGAHWQWLGYSSVSAMVADVRRSLAGQVTLMVRFIEKSGLVAALNAHDWQDFARRYNGPNYRDHRYDERLAAAYKRHRAPDDVPVPTEPSGLLRRGSSGETVLALQRQLIALGHPIEPDGQFGPATESALRQFQSDHELSSDGIAGPLTRHKLALDYAKLPKTMPTPSPADREPWLRRISRTVRVIFGRI